MMNISSPPDGLAIPSLGDAESARLGACMLEHAQAMAATKELGDFAASGWLPDEFFDALARLYSTYDAYIEHNVDASQLKVMCRAACARCCHQHVYSTFTFEIINLYRLLRGRTNYLPLFRALLASGQEFETMLASYRQKSPGREDLAVVSTLQHLSALAKPCPLLAGNQCGVYEHRPVSCRMYHSLSNPVLCTTVVGRTFHLVPPAQVMEVLAGINGRLLFPHSEYLAQGFVAFAALRAHRPWAKPVSVAA